MTIYYHRSYCGKLFLLNTKKNYEMFRIQKHMQICTHIWGDLGVGMHERD